MTATVKDSAATSPIGSAWLSVMPGLFVVFWSTGFIGAKFGLPYAEPLTFLALRFGIVAAIMLAVALASGAVWPATLRTVGHTAIVGLLIQATYLGGVYYGIAHGMSAGLSALIVSLQPVLTAAVARPILGEIISPRQWVGVTLGFAGVVLVVWSKLVFDADHVVGFITTAVALFGMTAGTLYQKRFCSSVDLRSATVIQNAVAGLAVLCLALLLETMHIAWRIEFVAALSWLCLVLSIGTMMLFLFILRRGAAARIASLFYLVPPVTAFMAYLLFGETLAATALAGMAFTAAGVALVTRG
jgi:drug/metabolite transporter (DMT)-like permease